jgi:hypothetical protein
VKGYLFLPKCWQEELMIFEPDAAWQWWRDKIKKANIWRRNLVVPGASSEWFFGFSLLMCQVSHVMAAGSGSAEG